MSSQRVTRRLQDLQDRLTSTRESLRVLDEQLAAWTEAYDDARLRSLMAETPQSDHDLSDVRRHFDVTQRECTRQKAEVELMVLERDRLLREWTPEGVS